MPIHRFANIEYESIADVANLKKPSKGKLSFISDGERIIADSEFIISYLQEKVQVSLDENLSVEQQSQSNW